ncbi:L-idonate 5-dehydrogenase [Hibiscus syriacus]|uniref:L-idonate 5-dehydrogenase n=1 Tax=Hibiscus syriacus TaxID=106335 RepID=A0A6A3AKX0_HIBSY|nr:L-idonate 5-dehydrogenase [Hibiscus syriacus]
MGKGGESHEENMAAWLVGINALKIQPFKLPPLGPHDVKVGMKAVGICGSDVHFLNTLRLADFIVKEPMVIGHECAGIIEEVGSEVKNLVPGDRVALETGISCWRCNPCKEGRFNLCDEMKFFATPPVHGPIGLVTILAARAFGGPRIVIVDVDEHRLSVAKDLGADGVVKDIPEEIERISKAMGAAIHVSFDCAGFNKTMSTAMTATRAGGRVDIIGILRYKNTWPLCIELLRSWKIDVKPPITHSFGFSQEEVEEAFETSVRGGNAIKVMFNL